MTKSIAIAKTGCAILAAASIAACAPTAEPPPQFKSYTVEMDTRDLYDGEQVKLNVTKKPVCGDQTSNGRGIKGAGMLESPFEGKPIAVVVEPCMDNPAVKLPDGRVLFLK